MRVTGTAFVSLLRVHCTRPSDSQAERLKCSIKSRSRDERDQSVLLNLGQETKGIKVFY